MKGEDGPMTTPPATPQNVVPLRTILRNFLNLVENCEARRNAGVDVYDKEFQELKLFSESLKSDPDYHCKEGEKSVNRKKNRYKDILPFDYSRVSLSDNGDIPGVDYHNANFIKGASGSSAYIACQGPLPHTVNDFWRMVVECEVQVIVMACMEQESGKHKCENYWVEEDGIERQFGQVTVWLKKCRNVCPDFLVRTMRIRYPNLRGEIEERNICQFHYSAWPDHGVPTRVRPLLDMVRLIRDCQTSETLPVLVHCSAGCGRTGTICAIDYVWGLLRLGKLTPDFSLFNLVREMRRQRIAMVQTKDQYILVHRAVKELFQEQLKIIEAHPYANVDHNGLPLDMKHELVEPMYETIAFQSPRTESSPGATPSPSPPKPHADITENNNIPPKPSAKPSRLPTSNSASRSKLKKEAENHQRQLELEKSRGSTSSSGSVRLKKGDYVHITPAHAASMDDLTQSCQLADVTEKPKSDTAVKGGKTQPPSGSPGRSSSLLRKPSINKLKAFFEKSPKEEKKSNPGTLLSRAKSDVSSSSRFYSFTSSFGSQRGNTTSTLVSPAPKDKDDSAHAKPSRTEAPPKEKSKTKPPLLAKPILPIKRSKSLKIHPTEAACETSAFSRDVESNPKNVSPSPYVSLANDNPIKVCVKQVVIPKLQSVVSSSVKPESLIATTHHSSESDFERPSSRRESLEPLLGRRSESDSPPPPRKPSLPSKSSILKSNHNYVNVGHGPNRTKVGIVKTLEDVPDFGRTTNSNSFNKYETVNPKNLSSITGSGLTRSQSHVWQAERPTLVDRIFSNDNLNKTEAEQKRTYHFTKSEQKHSKEKPVVLPPKSTPRFPVQDLSFSSGVMPLSPLLGKPIVRRRMPNANTYANYPLERSSPLGTSSHQQYDEPQAPSPSRLKDSPNPLPQLKNNGHISGHYSRGNSSDSSNSLPSTPTQSIDVLYPQMSRSSYGKNTSTQVQRTLHSTPKSILKGSLSSTPSESDERLDSGRPNPVNTSVTTICNNNGSKVGNRLSTLGVRERRNSFRQAVWKEAQNDGQQYHPPSQPTSNYLSASVLCQNNVGLPSSDTSDRLGPRPHKDYEPIWPDGNASNTAFRVGSGIGSESRSSEVNTNLGIKSNTGPCAFNAAGTEESRITSTTITSTPFQSRVEDIKVLLEELRAPMGVVFGANANAVSADATKKSNNHLKYHRSLKAPSRSQYHNEDQVGSMSCFTFRKPTSLESITDQVQMEIDEDYRSLLTPRALLPKPEGLKSTSVVPVGPGRGSQNEYVSLTQCRTEAQEECHANGQHNNYHTSSHGTPIPPPRTKGKRGQHQRMTHQAVGYDVPDSCPHRDDYLGEREERSSESNALGNSGRSSLSVWRNESPRVRMDLNGDDVPDGKRGMQNHLNQVQPSGGAGSTATSPKALVRAIGLFQAKAANVRSKFSNWTENSKERRQNSTAQSSSTFGDTGQSRRTGQLNGNSSEMRERRSPPQYDNGFKTSHYTSGSTSTASNSTRTTKHQYL